MSALVDALAAETGLRILDIRRIMQRAPSAYKTYFIPKRTGGSREISQPTSEVKFVQRALVRVLLDRLPVHKCATAYQSGKSILDNALPHAGHRPILKIDLKDFFPSINASDWARYCRDKSLSLSDEEIALTSRLLFKGRKGSRSLTLAIGAPSSPALSNVLMYDFDNALINNLENDQIVYTRYADDLTFSAPRTGYLNQVMRSVAKTIREIESPRLEINSKKTTLVTTTYGRRVTGLTLTNDGRVTIGHENKRKLHAAVHKAKMGKATPDELQIAAGMLAYVNAVEPAFLVALRKRYGEETVAAIQRSVQVGKRPSPHLPPLAQGTSIAAGDPPGKEK